MQKKPEIEELLTINETCELLKISRPTFYRRFVKGGEIKIVKVGDRMRVSPRELKRYMTEGAR